MLGAFHNGILHLYSNPPWKVGSGLYTGTGSAQSINVGFNPQLIIIKSSGSTANADPVISWQGMYTSGGTSPGTTMIDPTSAATTGFITSYDTNGFTISSNAVVNTNAVGYTWMAIGGGPSVIRAGSYVGNGIDNSDMITGLTFQPRLMFIRRRDSDASRVVARWESMTGDSTYQLGLASSTAANLIQQFNSDGAQVGSSTVVNGSSSMYDWVALNPSSSHSFFGKYIGTGSPHNEVNGPNWTPTVALSKGQVNSPAIMRVSAHTLTLAMQLEDSLADAGQRLTAFVTSGFTVGNNAASNASGFAYYYFQFRSS